MAETSFTGRINGIVFENNQDLFKIIDVDLISKLADYDRDNILVILVIFRLDRLINLSVKLLYMKNSVNNFVLVHMNLFYHMKREV